MVFTSLSKAVDGADEVDGSREEAGDVLIRSWVIGPNDWLDWALIKL